MIKFCTPLGRLRRLAVPAFVILSVFGSSAHAVPQLRLDDGISPAITITDNGAGDVNAAPGVIDFSQTIGVFAANSGSAVTKPVLGAANDPVQQLNSLNLSFGAGTMTLLFTETDFTAAAPTDLSLAFGGATDGTVTYEVFASSSNTAFALDTLIGGSGALSGIHDAAGSGSIPFTGPYSLTTRVTITHTGSGVFNTSINSLVMTVPAAGFLPVVVAGALFAARRRRARA